MVILLLFIYLICNILYSLFEYRILISVLLIYDNIILVRHTKKNNNVSNVYCHRIYKPPFHTDNLEHVGTIPLQCIQ